MDAQTCLRKLEYVGTLAFATVDAFRRPQIRNISAIHYESDALYFFTARGKNFCRELLEDGMVQVLGLTKYKEMIRLSGQAIVVSWEETKRWIDVIFSEQPYLENVYPGSTRESGVVFSIRDAEIEYFNLSETPIFRESYVIGAGKLTPKGYVIQNQCVGCGKCMSVCPQHCITEGEPFVIDPLHCLHCGNCAEHCPSGAIRRLE